MKNADTPETDEKSETRIVKGKPRNIVDSEFARQMERQRNELLATLQDLSALCERAWDGRLIGKPSRNRAKRMIAKYLENA